MKEDEFEFEVGEISFQEGIYAMKITHKKGNINTLIRIPDNHIQQIKYAMDFLTQQYKKVQNEKR